MLLDVFQYPLWNKHVSDISLVTLIIQFFFTKFFLFPNLQLSYKLFDALIEEIFPELSESQNI